ncbi:MAG: signal peptidase I [Candidatus Bathyarchaeales archaeon]
MKTPNPKKLAKIALLALIATFLIIFLVFYRPVALLGDTRYEPVYTGSMEPAIPVGSIVVIKPAVPETLTVGDIICFKIEAESPTTVTHRIIDVTNEGFKTKGDANEDPDPWTVKKQDVVGKVIAVIPYIGYLGYFIRTPIGFILLIIIPATILILIEIKNIIKEIKKQKQTTSKAPSSSFLTRPLPKL